MDDIVVPDEPRWPGLSGLRWFAIGFFGVLVAAGGWGAARLHVGFPGSDGYVYAGVVLFLAFLMYLSGQALARGGVEDGGFPVVGTGPSLLVAVALAAGGAAAGGWGGWIAAAVAAAAAAGAVPAVAHARRWRLWSLEDKRERALLEWRIRHEGETVRAALVEVARISDSPDYDGRYHATLTLRYPFGGTEHTKELRTSFPAHSRPRAGDGATVRFLAADPTDVRLELDEPRAPQDAPAAAPQDADLPARIERLHDLHRRGALTAEEFTLAKRRLLTGE
ncbi:MULTISPECIES: SHOCT domain-containing protein [Kitasatospora]|uniref:SHOCT domain-containing protein n=1 Tax=Kitasatospora setae (strain ATCC 33774 / DSM 43861 / JCM 3304 / KCC A-0304 / NBRC 14216 / KM-6054) TaxID=452652 RepID=E4N1T9_KITSK|nr:MULTISPECIES: SHOCT domain-containing protein [Kitasatospora]BAJ32123.1 hypothetical protein KSE_63640 [Kitasatospora setae KM-6054]